jgi:hypothetical protein
VGEDVGDYAIQNGLSAQNYTINYSGANLSITKAPLTITADAQSKVYGDVDPTLSYTATDFKFNDTAASTLTGLLSRVSGENVGNYVINQGNLDAGANYHITFNSNSLTITPAQLNLINASGVNKAYDATTAATLNLNSASLTGILASDIGNIGINYTGYLANFSSANAGVNLPINVTNLITGSAVSNYTLIKPNLSATISPRNLTVTANSATKLENTTDPALTYTVASLLANDNLAQILAGQLVRQSGEAPGNYLIMQGDLTSISNNYIINQFNNGTLTILNQPVANNIGTATNNPFVLPHIDPDTAMPTYLNDKSGKIIINNANEDIYSIVSKASNTENNMSLNVNLQCNSPDRKKNCAIGIQTSN